MSKPFFTVLICALNRRNEIEHAITSVLAQEHNEFEVIIVDNGSDDGTYEFCKSIQDSRVTVTQCPTRGLAFARNHGIRLAKGQWITKLDSDNLFATTDVLSQLEKQINDYTGSNHLMNGLFSRSITHDGRELAFCYRYDFFISFGEYLTKIKGEFCTTVRTDWIKKHLYPEIEGAITEFPHCVWLPLAKTGGLFISSLKSQIYGNESTNRICTHHISQSRARELSYYYFMILRDFGNEIYLNAGKSKYFELLIKLLCYNRLSKTFDSNEMSVIRGRVLSCLFSLIPSTIIRKTIEYIKFSRFD